MPGGDVRRLAVSSSPKLTPDEIASRSFGRAVRGVSEQEVRSFLTRVAEEVGALNDREDALRERIRALESELANPPAPTEQQLLDAEEQVIRGLGEKGRVVIVGRGAAHMFGDDRHVLRVFLHAPIEDRITLAMAEYGFTDRDQAELVVRESTRRIRA